MKICCIIILVAAIPNMIVYAGKSETDMFALLVGIYIMFFGMSIGLTTSFVYLCIKQRKS